MQLKIGPLPKVLQRVIEIGPCFCAVGIQPLKGMCGGCAQLPHVWRMSHFLEEKENLWNLTYSNMQKINSMTAIFNNKF